jgi:hypothetical protein
MAKYISYADPKNIMNMHHNDEIKNYFQTNLLLSYNYIQITDIDWDKIREGGGVYEVIGNTLTWLVNKDDETPNLDPSKTPPRESADESTRLNAKKVFIPKSSIQENIYFLIAQCTKIESIDDFPEKSVWASLKTTLSNVDMSSWEDPIEATSWVKALETKSVLLNRGPFELAF